MEQASIPVRGLANRDRASKIGRHVGRWLLALAPLAWLTAMFVVPLAFTFVYAFANATYGGVQVGFTWVNFSQALSGFYLQIFLRTLRFAATGTLLTFLIGAPLAYFVARKVKRFRLAFLILLLVPFWTSFLIRTLAWETLLAADGPIRNFINFLGLHHGDINVLDTSTAVFIGIVYGYLPLMTLPLFVAFERIPHEVGEASKDLGAGRVRTFLRVTLPLAKPGVVAGVLLTFVPMTGEYVIPALLGGDKGVLMGGLIADQYLLAQNVALGSAMAVLVLVVLGVFVFVLIRVTGGFRAVPQ
jgi:ABC-type spermidine/putrescine transport system permease subunit I